MTVEGLAQALCDSSSHMNLLPRAEQRPCEYHRKRAKDTLALLARSTKPRPTDGPPPRDPDAELSRLSAEAHQHHYGVRP